MHRPAKNKGHIAYHHFLFYILFFPSKLLFAQKGSSSWLMNGPQRTACLTKGYINDKCNWTEEKFIAFSRGSPWIIAQCRSKLWHWSQCRPIPVIANQFQSMIIPLDRHWEVFQINARIWLALIGIGDLTRESWSWGWQLA